MKLKVQGRGFTKLEPVDCCELHWEGKVAQAGGRRWPVSALNSI